MDVGAVSAGTAPALDARELYRFYRAGDEETLALRGVSLTVAPGELVAVVGPSGSGKSTLLACLAGLDEPAGGSVRIAGERISHRPEAERAGIRARRIGILLQTENLIAHLDVARNIRLARTAAGRHRTPAQDIDVLRDQVGLLGRAHALPRELAGGELARAALAVALANDPDLLLADEPTGELDGSTEHRILELLRARGSEGRRGLLLVTHSTAVMGGADRVLTLRDGRLRP
ncbi:ATP-binding cassette domain-containing protein [Streptomyces goshikiensis]|uniref:ABC transporter ATP-binding protein n=1 Tax=Streptomyces goshikiensis TaxID=1942 RepID=UPI003333B516